MIKIIDIKEKIMNEQDYQILSQIEAKQQYKLQENNLCFYDE